MLHPLVGICVGESRTSTATTLDGVTNQPTRWTRPLPSQLSIEPPVVSISATNGSVRGTASLQSKHIYVEGKDTLASRNGSASLLSKRQFVDAVGAEYCAQTPSGIQS